MTISTVPYVTWQMQYKGAKSEKTWNTFTWTLVYTGCGKKVDPWSFFAVFSATFLNFNLKFYNLLKPSTSNCQIKYDSVKKQQSYRLFNMTAYRLRSIQKFSGYNTNLRTALKQHSRIMIGCQNSIVTANVQSVHHQLQATTPASNHFIWQNLLQPCWSVPVAGCPK